MKKYYLAYGSNLNKAQMAQRCPTATPVAALLLENWQLMFSTYATIVRREGAAVPSVVWEIDEQCEDALDIYEGYPELYRKEQLEVTVNGEMLTAMVYIKNYSKPIPPTQGYYERVFLGYKDFGLDVTYLRDALDFDGEE